MCKGREREREDVKMRPYNKNGVRDIATFFEQPLQYGGCISDFENHCCNLISKEVAAAILKMANTTSNLGLVLVILAF